MTSLYKDEIYEQPDVIRKLVRDQNGQIRRLAEQLKSKPPSYIIIGARGTSDNAATYAKYLFGMFNHMPVGLAMPSLFTLYKQPPRMYGGLVIGISQSGQTPDVLSMFAEAKRQGVPSVAITNKADSPMAKAADHAIHLNAGLEKAVPASKTYTAQLTAIAAIAAHWCGDSALIHELDGLADDAQEVLVQEPAAQAAAKRFAKKNYMVIVGRGLNQCTASEIALKTKELSYMVAESYSAADFRHGPIAMLEDEFPVVAVAPRGMAAEDMTQMIEEIHQTNADLAVISNIEPVLSQCDLPIRLPTNLPEWLSPMIATIPGQLLALHLCLEKGYDPDRPRGLKKVTLTR
jgi:glucosamine--fructose-6-phosphate aminotransferase (isomerizing)